MFLFQVSLLGCQRSTKRRDWCYLQSWLTESNTAATGWMDAGWYGPMTSQEEWWSSFYTEEQQQFRWQTCAGSNSSIALCISWWSASLTTVQAHSGGSLHCFVWGNLPHCGRTLMVSNCSTCCWQWSTQRESTERPLYRWRLLAHRRV